MYKSHLLPTRLSCRRHQATARQELTQAIAYGGAQLIAQIMYRDEQLIAPFTVVRAASPIGEGACNRTVFETWLETCLIPVLRPREWGKQLIMRRFIMVVGLLH